MFDVYVLCMTKIFFLKEYCHFKALYLSDTHVLYVGSKCSVRKVGFLYT